jgi:hypothetical protein
MECEPKRLSAAVLEQPYVWRGMNTICAELWRPETLGELSILKIFVEDCNPMIYNHFKPLRDQIECAAEEEQRLRSSGFA